MADLFNNIYRISSARLQTWDYGSNAAYFITICTQNRVHYFGEIEPAKSDMRYTEIGLLANNFWNEIPRHFTFVQLGAFVIMPNHVHGIVIINKPGDKNELLFNSNPDENPIGNGGVVVETRHCLVSTPQTNRIQPSIPGQKRFQNQGKNTISSIIGSYKSVVTKQAHLVNHEFAWQSRFHDHIIRNAEEYNRIEKYILNNPTNWKEDKFCSRLQ